MFAGARNASTVEFWSGKMSNDRRINGRTPGAYGGGPTKLPYLTRPFPFCVESTTVQIFVSFCRSPRLYRFLHAALMIY
jgi:hypothetical protein